MSAFEYDAISLTGGKKRGVIEADSERHARSLLREQKLLPSRIKAVPKRKNSAAKKAGLFDPRMKTRDKVVVTRQLANLIRAALPVEEALRTIADHNNAPIRRFLSSTRSRIVEGVPLHQALEEQAVFDSEYTATIAAGEKTGELALVMEKLANDIERREKFSRNVTSAMIYPAFILLVAVSVVVALLTFVVPEVVAAFVKTNKKLPQLTLIMIGISDFFRNHGALLLLSGVGSVALFKIALRNKTFKRSWHRLLMRAPVIGKIFVGGNTAQFARNFSLMQASGVTVIDALRSTARTLSCLPMCEAIMAGADEIREGSSIYRALEKHKALPPMTLYMLASGEASGNISEMLNRAAINQEGELEAFTSGLISVLGPLIILVMGGFVLVILLSILLPIFELNASLG